MSIEDGPGSVPLGANKFKASAVKMTEKSDGSYNPCAGDRNLLDLAYARTKDEVSPEAASGKALTHKLWVWSFWFFTLGLYLVLSGPNSLGEDSTKAQWNVTNSTDDSVSLEIVPMLAYPQNIIGFLLILAALACDILGTFFVENSPGFRMAGCRLCGCNGCNWLYFLLNDLTCGLGGICLASVIAEPELVGNE
jgi:hypothetical protein